MGSLLQFVGDFAVENVPEPVNGSVGQAVIGILSKRKPHKIVMSIVK